MKNFFNKKFSTKTKLISSAISLMLIVCFAITGTVAWLIDATEEVTDTFTYGNVEIELRNSKNDELWSDTDTQKEFCVDNRDGNGNKLIPGATISYDPYVKNIGSESCYVFIELTYENNLLNYSTLSELGSKWVKVEDFVYAYVADASVQNPALLKLNSGDATDGFGGAFKVFETLENDDFTSITDTTKPKVNITAYAIQADYLTADTPAGVWALIKNP